MNYTHITQGRIYPHPDGKRRRTVLPNFAAPERGGWVLVKGGRVFGDGPELGDIELFIEEIHPQARSFFVTGHVRFKHLLHALADVDPCDLPMALRRLGLHAAEVDAFVEEIVSGEQYEPDLPGLELSPDEPVWARLLGFASSCSSGRPDMSQYQRAIAAAAGRPSFSEGVLHRARIWCIAELAETYRAELREVSHYTRETSHGVYMVSVQANGGYAHQYLTAEEDGRWTVVPPRAEPLSVTATSLTSAADLAVAHFMQTRCESPAALAAQLGESPVSA